MWTGLWTIKTVIFYHIMAKMCGLIWTYPKHTKYQRILYRSSEENDMTDYQFTTVKLGDNCVPYLALRTHFKSSYDEEYRFPVGPMILRKNI